MTKLVVMIKNVAENTFGIALSDRSTARLHRCWQPNHSIPDPLDRFQSGNLLQAGGGLSGLRYRQDGDLRIPVNFRLIHLRAGRSAHDHLDGIHDLVVHLWEKSLKQELGG